MPGPARGYVRPGEVCVMLFLVASMPRSERLPNRQTRNDQRFTTDLTWIFLLARRRSMPLCIVALTFRHARTARMRWERVAFLKAPKSGARRDNSVVYAAYQSTQKTRRCEPMRRYPPLSCRARQRRLLNE